MRVRPPPALLKQAQQGESVADGPCSAGYLQERRPSAAVGQVSAPHMNGGILHMVGRLSLRWHGGQASGYPYPPTISSKAAVSSLSIAMIHRRKPRSTVTVLATRTLTSLGCGFVRPR